MSDFTGKVVMVTGATSGFGAATARRFATKGARVIATGRRGERLDALREAVGDVVMPLPFDVRDEAAVNAAFAGLAPPFDEIDVLVNNAGLARGLSRADEASMDDWNEMVDTNIRGLMYCTRAVLPRMVARGRGHIVNLGSVAGAYPYPGANVYGGTKAFVAQFSLNLRADLVGKNIRVSCIEPGAAETEFSLVRFHGDTAKADGVYKGLQALTGEDVADAIEYVVSAPPHVNINRIEIMAAQQAFAGFNFLRDEA
jgi:3-hydroxy acid dehydrogenase/malonic semialdehyde reductase